MNTENDILDPKLKASDNTNDPTYHGPDGNVFICKRNLTLYLAQTKLPKAVYDHVSFASQALTLPPPRLTPVSPLQRATESVGGCFPDNQTRSTRERFRLIPPRMGRQQASSRGPAVVLVRLSLKDKLS
jgi:hypothetical protein